MMGALPDEEAYERGNYYKVTLTKDLLVSKYPCTQGFV